MSVSVNEINYLIWRYLQESGLEVSAYALEDETTINKLDSTYSPHVPLGCLVDLVQKGILYSKMTELVASTKANSIVQDDIINLNFNFFTALHQINANESTSERKILNADEQNGTLENSQPSTVATSALTTTGEIASNGDDKIKEEDTQQEKDEQLDTQASALADSQNDKSDFIKVLKDSLDYDSSYSVCFSPVKKDLVAWSQRNNQSIIYSFDTKSKIEMQLPLACKETLLISWSPVGNSVVTASENGELRLWSTDGTLEGTLAMHHWPIVSIDWSPSGKYILSLDIRNVAVVWDVITGTVVSHLDKESWSHVDKSLNELISDENNTTSTSSATATATASATTTTTTDTITTSTKETEPVNKNYGTDTCWLDDNKFVIPGPKYTLLVCQVTTDTANSIIGILTGHEESVCCVKYDPKLRLLCSASEDGTIRIWRGNSTNSLQILTGHSLAVSMLEFINISDKWYLLSTSIDGTIRIWDFVQNETIDLISVDDGQAVLSAALYEDNETHDKFIATGDSSGSICVWKIANDNNNIKIRQIGLYQHFEDNGEDQNMEDSGYVSEISWNNDGSKIAVSFSVGKSVVIDMP